MSGVSDPGPRPEFLWLQIDALSVDGRYQRAADSDGSKAIIRKIARDFSWAKFGAITVARRPDGRYAVIDGQHRVKGAAERPDIDAVPCLVVACLVAGGRPEDDGGLAAEAKNFVGINRDRVNMGALPLYHARVAAGDPEAAAIARVCFDANVTVPRNPAPAGDTAPGITTAIGAIGKGLKLFGDKPVLAALRILVKAFHDKRGQLRGSIIGAMIHFFAIHKKQEVDLDRLARTLAEFDVQQLEQNARTYKKIHGGTSEAAIRAAVTKAYNSRLGPANRLPEDI